MNPPNEDRKPTDNMEQLKQQAACCGPGCGCHTTGTPGKTRWAIGAIVLVAAGVMVVRAMIKSDEGSRQTIPPTFASLGASQTPPLASDAALNSAVPAPAAETSVGTSIGALAELNTVAADTGAVLVFVPGKEAVAGNPPSTTMKGAAKMIESKAGLKCGLCTLRAGTRDYDQIAAQMAVPGVLAMVKGRGMSAVSGDITESKLLQGFVAASSASGCSPSAGSACCPK